MTRHPGRSEAAARPRREGATEWSQGYSANSGGSQQLKVVVTQCSVAAKPDGVLLGCGGQDILIPVTVTVANP